MPVLLAQTLRRLSQAVRRLLAAAAPAHEAPRATPFRTRLVWSAVIVGLFMSVIVWTLAATVPNISVTSLLPEGGKLTVYPVELYYSSDASRPGVQRASIKLNLGQAQALVRHLEIQLTFGTYQTEPNLIDGRLSVLGTPCVYKTKPGALLENNQRLGFVVTPPCQTFQTGTGELQLDLDYQGSGRIAIWTVPLPQGTTATADEIWTADTALPLSTPTALVDGDYVDYLAGRTYRRIDLLAYMWQVADGPGWIWWAVLLGAVSAWLGALVFPYAALDKVARLGVPALRVWAGTFCFAFTLSLFYAVFTPPFQSPDEPTHFLAFVQEARAQRAEQMAPAWAALTHFGDLRFHPSARFTPGYIGSPRVDRWAEEPVGNAQGRSSTTQEVWAIIGPFLRGLPAPGVLLAVRLFNAIVFGLACALAASAVSLTTSSIPFPQLAGFPLFMVPTLPFFGMGVSNYATLTSAYVLLSASALVMFLDGERSHYVGLLLGSSTGIALTTSRSAMPMIFVIVCLLGLRMALGSRQAVTWKSVAYSAGVFWIAFWSTSSLLLFLATHQFATLNIAMANMLLPEAGIRLSHLPMAPATAVMALTAVGIGCEFLCFEVRRKLSGFVRRALGVVVRVPAVFAAAGILTIMASSIVIAYPHLASVDLARRPSPRAYVTSVFSVLFTSFRLRSPDLLLSRTFWTGFGWLDTFPNAALTSTLAAASGLMLVWMLTDLVARSDIRRLIYVYGLSVAFCAALAGYAISTLQFSPDLHGRYLIGLYLTMLMLSWSALATVGRSQRIASWWNRIRPIPPLFVAFAVHTYALSFILQRYF